MWWMMDVVGVAGCSDCQRRCCGPSQSSCCWSPRRRIPRPRSSACSCSSSCCTSAATPLPATPGSASSLTPCPAIRWERWGGCKGRVGGGAGLCVFVPVSQAGFRRGLLVGVVLCPPPLPALSPPPPISLSLYFLLVKF